MKKWTINVFVDENGYCDFTEEWRKKLPMKARARMDRIIRHMEVVKDWTQTAYFTPLSTFKGICEIKFTVSNIQYRPLGCYGPDEDSFTLLIGAREHGDRFEPKNAPWVAVKRRQLVLGNRRYTREYY